jgi:putative membrane protein
VSSQAHTQTAARQPKDYALVALKGLAMGAADVVPGISGGTIAFITGIYDELLDSLKAINPTSARQLFRQGPLVFWQTINGSFLLALALGIGLSIFSLARVMRFLLAHHAVLLWAFFFGLILASAIYVARRMAAWHLSSLALGLLGAVLSFWLTLTTPADTSLHAPWFVFVSGAIAICAMILPGISGSFVLLLLGQYAFILGAISDLNLVVLMIFGAGAAIGLLAFSHLLSWILNHYRNLTIAFLTGLMLGALNKVWPWKQVIETYTDRHGAIKPLVEMNVLPGQFPGDPQLFWVVALASVGFALIFVVEGIATWHQHHQDALATSRR